MHARRSIFGRRGSVRFTRMSQRTPSRSERSWWSAKSIARRSGFTNRHWSPFGKASVRNNYDIAVTLNNLAALHCARGEFASAERYYQRALTMKEKLFGRNHVDVAVTLNNLAVLHRARGEYARATALYKEALAIFIAALPPEHPQVAACRRDVNKVALSLAEAPGGSAQAKTRSSQGRSDAKIFGGFCRFPARCQVKGNL